MMEQMEREHIGTLQVNLLSNSGFLGRNVPIEVRDSDMRLVKRAHHKRSFDLPEGLYEVSTVLEDGRRHRALVRLTGGRSTSVKFGTTESPPAAKRGAEPGEPVYQPPSFTRLSVSQEPSRLAAKPVVEWLETDGASLMRQTSSIGFFLCAPDIAKVPSVNFRVREHIARISLPISPTEYTPSSKCAVKIDRSPTGFHAEAWMSPERTVANAMQNMLASGHILEAASVAEDAFKLFLWDKYEDPTGALLGALILQKTGRLHRRQSWVENLVRDFDWLPDGKVMLAALLVEEPSSRDRALELALQASRQRMLFSENFSLLLNLLRRWPEDNAREERLTAIDRLSAVSANIGWESICLEHGLQE